MFSIQITQEKEPTLHIALQKENMQQLKHILGIVLEVQVEIKDKESPTGAIQMSSLMELQQEQKKPIMPSI